jgi:hypothetical protein
MPRKRLAVTVATITILTLAAPQAALAATTLNQVISNLQTWLMGILAAFATLLLVIGGVRYLAAGQDPGQLERAKGAIKAAIGGYALALLAPVLVSLVQKIAG